MNIRVVLIELWVRHLFDQVWSSVSIWSPKPYQKWFLKRKPEPCPVCPPQNKRIISGWAPLGCSHPSAQSLLEEKISTGPDFFTSEFHQTLRSKNKQHLLPLLLKFLQIIKEVKILYTHSYEATITLISKAKIIDKI